MPSDSRPVLTPPPPQQLRPRYRPKLVPRNTHVAHRRLNNPLPPLLRPPAPPLRHPRARTPRRSRLPPRPAPTIRRERPLQTRPPQPQTHPQSSLVTQRRTFAPKRTPPQRHPLRRRPPKRRPPPPPPETPPSTVRPRAAPPRGTHPPWRPPKKTGDTVCAARQRPQLTRHSVKPITQPAIKITQNAAIPQIVPPLTVAPLLQTAPLQIKPAVTPAAQPRRQSELLVLLRPAPPPPPLIKRQTHRPLRARTTRRLHVPPP